MKFVSEPYLPSGDGCLFIKDATLKINNSFFLDSFKTNYILKGTDSHPDMTFCHIKDNTVAVANDSFEYYNKLLKDKGFNILKGKNKIEEKYPLDIAFNCVIINKTLYHKLDYTDRVILDYLKGENYKLVNVNQGYTKCSTLIVDNNSVITSDIGLHNVYINNGLDSLFVSSENIGINNFEHGFIGGTGGRINNNTIGFFGDIEAHPQFNEIRLFLYERGIKYISLCPGKLFDYGSLICIMDS